MFLNGIFMSFIFKLFHLSKTDYVIQTLHKTMTTNMLVVITVHGQTECLLLTSVITSNHWRHVPHFCVTVYTRVKARLLVWPLFYSSGVV